MSEISDRYATVADGFSERVGAVPTEAWNNASPCADWTARDVVRHLVEWIPGYFSGAAGLSLPTCAAVDDYPARAWTTLDAALRDALTDPSIAAREFDGPPGRMSVEQSIDMIVTGDLLIHTWDLARATGLDETLDAGEVHRMLVGTAPLDDMLRTSGHYGARVPIADNADETAKLLAFLGRDPALPIR